jgi:hypothetical protein
MKITLAIAGLVAAAAVSQTSNVAGPPSAVAVAPQQGAVALSPDAAFRLVHGSGNAAAHAGDWAKAFTVARR